MTDKLTVVIVHYHLRPGGVTRVIERAVESLNDSVDFFCISGEVLPEDAQLFPISGIFEPLEYSNATEFPDLGNSIDGLKELARGFFGRDPDIWHIHNHSLGKNGFLPQLVWQLANEGARVLLQPHDFAEDGRAANYALLKKALGKQLNSSLYPDANHVWYAPINFRDKSFLESISLSNVRMLPNSVTAHNSPDSEETKKTIVYPARAIRRKNIGEFLLWSLLAPEGYFFQSTLAPQNPTWQVYYDQWVSFAKELNLPVEFNAGHKHEFSELVQNAEALMTTSIQEGFGLAFIEPWMEGKNLIGRKLPEITTDFEEEGLDLSSLYTTLPIPLEWAGKEVFLQTLETVMKETYEAYSKPWKAENLAEAEAALVMNGKVDFGVLDEKLQMNVIRHLSNHPEDKKELPAFNPSGSTSRIAKNQSVAETNYSQKAYAERLSEIYNGLSSTSISDISSADASALLEQFLKPARFNLLRV